MTSPRPVLWLLDSLRLGGAERLALDFLLHCDRSRWRPTLLCWERGDGAGGELELEAAARRLELPVEFVAAHRLRDADARRRLSRRAAELRPALIHAHLAYATIHASALARRLRVPLLATLHVMPGLARGRQHWVERLYLRAMNHRAAAILALSREQRRRWIAAGLRADKIAVLPNGAGGQAEPAAPAAAASRRKSLRDRWGIPPSAPLVVTVAAVRAEKGWRTWIAGLDALGRAATGSAACGSPSAPPLAIHPAEDPRADRPVFVWLGGGPEWSLLRRAAQDRPGVLVPGFSAEVSDWLAAADLFLFPSAGEALPTAMLEAMAAGLATVAFDLPVHREVLGFAAGPPPSPPSDESAEQIGDCGQLVPVARDPVAAGRSLLSTALELLADSGLRARLGRNARRRWERLYSRRRWLDALGDCYDRQLGAVRGAAA